MSKYVKDLVTTEYKADFEGVGDLLLVNISGMNAKNVGGRDMVVNEARPMEPRTGGGGGGYGGGGGRSGGGGGGGYGGGGGNRY
jgi:hypothetical protein